MLGDGALGVYPRVRLFEHAARDGVGRLSRQAGVKLARALGLTEAVLAIAVVVDPVDDHDTLALSDRVGNLLGRARSPGIAGAGDISEVDVVAAVIQDATDGQWETRDSEATCGTGVPGRGDRTAIGPQDSRSLEKMV